MSFSYNDIFNEMLEELNKNLPSTIEEAEEVVKKDDEAYKAIVTAANINAIVQLLINKGIITQEEYTTWYNASEQACLKAAAQIVLDEANNRKGI